MFSCVKTVELMKNLKAINYSVKYHMVFSYVNLQYK